MNVFVILLSACILMAALATPIAEGFHVQYVIMKNPHVEVKPSPLLKNKGRGLFTTKSYKEGDIIEVCPTLTMKKSDISKDNIINEHLFKGNKPGNNILALGYCTLINHSRDKQNCTWEVADDDSFIKMIATKDIKCGEELYSNYGAGYWKSRGYAEL